MRPLNANTHTRTQNAQGHPIFVERLGMLDAERIEREKLSEETILTYHQREMEFMAQVCLELRWCARLFWQIWGPWRTYSSSLVKF